MLSSTATPRFTGGDPKLVHPRRLQLRHVLFVDLVKLGVPLRLVAPGVGQPVRRLALGLDDAVVGNLSEGWPSTEDAREHHRRNHRLHGSVPRRLTRYATRSVSSGAVSRDAKLGMMLFPACLSSSSRSLFRN